ncbi:MAG: nucleoside hydrolase [Pseudomonadales bacterium]|jgi:inosine-uridine nucleoside N-ribohydrolase|nr:nucleoside hydrolase [Pseudomonadales bacterium]
MAHRIVFDTDPGIDDAMALLFAHASPEIELLGITTTFGNATVEQTTRNALLIADRFGIACPVHRGAAAPLVGEADAPPDFVHGRDGLGEAGFEPSPREPTGDAAAFLVETIRKHPGEITVVAVGRMTNLARALERDPEIAGLVKGIVVMGGAFGREGHAGNVTPCAEANMHGDAHAADRVMTAAWPLTLVPLDVTHRTRMAPAILEALAARGGERGAFIERIARFYRDFYARTGAGEAFPVHDSSAVACLLAPELYAREQGALRVVTEGIAKGQTLFAQADRFYALDGWRDLPRREVCLGVEADAVLELWLETLCR